MTTKKEILTAIKNKCREDCCAGDIKSWTECTITECLLYPYRMGKDPKPSKGLGKGLQNNNPSRKHHTEDDIKEKSHIEIENRGRDEI